MIELILFFIGMAHAVPELDADNTFNFSEIDSSIIPLFESPRKQLDSLDTQLWEVKCNNGYFLALKTDFSKSACVTPNTLDELISRNWALSHTSGGGYGMDANSVEEFSRTCNESDHIVIQGGYTSLQNEDNLKIINYEETYIDDLPGFNLTLFNPSDNKLGGTKVPGLNIWIDCFDPNPTDMGECSDTGFRSDKNWPIIECFTLDGKYFSYNEIEERAKTSGLSFYTVNHLDENSIEFVGKTDRIENEILFTVTDSDNNTVLSFKKFAPEIGEFYNVEGEFRITVNIDEPIPNEIYTITAKQIEFPYYEAILEFELLPSPSVKAICETCYDSPEELAAVLEHCEGQKLGLRVNHPYLLFSNSTHFIDNVMCEFEIVDESNLNERYERELLIESFRNDPVYLAFMDKYSDVHEDFRIKDNFEGKVIMNAYNQTNNNHMALEIHKYNDNPDMQTFLHCRVVHPEDSSFEIHTYAEGKDSISFIEKEDCLNKLIEMYEGEVLRKNEN